MTDIKLTLYLLGAVWVLAVALLTLGLTNASKRGRESEREHDLDERMGEE
jgi:hypothetical protein